jgi:chitin disaccharide deacetylase
MQPSWPVLSLSHSLSLVIRLIVNADDLGANSARTHGIFQAFEQGIVQCATLLANGSHSDTAAKWAREKHLPTGLHLNLTEGYPLSPAADIQTLLHANGTFLERHELRRALDEGMIDPLHVEREIRVQMEWFYDSHGAPTHVDGHHHIHIHPAIVPLLLPVLERYGIAFVRIPSEPLPPHGYEIPADHLASAQAICEQAEAARTLYKANGIGSTENFRGLALVGHASKRNLRHTFSRLPEGTCELMVHPGSPAAEGTPFDLDPQRQTELQMLMDPEIDVQLKRYDIRLCSFADLF